MKITREQRESWVAATRDSPFNRWLGAKTLDSHGQFDLERLRTIAAEFGIETAKYQHLNAGQQRMSIGNRLRAMVPSDTYAAYVDDAAVVPAEVSSPPYPFLCATPVSELLRMQSAIVDTLRDRGIVRTSNAPLGDYAEHLFATAFDWTLTPNSGGHFDATDSAGIRYQIKARRMRNKSASERHLSVMRQLPEKGFDQLASVLFAADFSVLRAAIIPHQIVLDRSKPVSHVNGWRFKLDDVIWSLPGIRDVTDELRAAANMLDETKPDIVPAP